MGYSVFVGIGIGLFLQNTMLAVQWTYAKSPKDISRATNVAVFLGFVGRILGTSLGGVVFANVVC